jgi:hypothetical protein
MQSPFCVHVAPNAAAPLAPPSVPLPASVAPLDVAPELPPELPPLLLPLLPPPLPPLDAVPLLLPLPDDDPLEPLDPEELEADADPLLDPEPDEVPCDALPASKCSYCATLGSGALQPQKATARTVSDATPTHDCVVRCMPARLCTDEASAALAPRS